MRIISGSHKGRIINPPAGLKLRPTTGLAREGLFNILNNILDYEELQVLDLFAGTGSISYEFASRGAELVHSVEINPKHAAFISSTQQKLNLDQIKVFRADVRKHLAGTPYTYNLIFADPPYDLTWLDNLPTMVMGSKCLLRDGIFILEHSRNYSFSNHDNFWQNRKYGSVNFTFFRIPG